MTFVLSLLAGFAGQARAQAASPVPQLTIEMVCEGKAGGCALLLTAGQTGELALIVAGCEPSVVKLPFGDHVFVRPDIVVVAGTFSATGTLRFPIGPRTGAAIANGCVGALAQAVGFGHDADGTPRTRSSNVIEL